MFIERVAYYGSKLYICRMGFLKEGKKKETQFSKLFKGVEFSNQSDDINGHWDLKVESKIDVKGLKKISRSDITTNEDYHFIEIQNVDGKKGWVYGEADYFAFETNYYWVIVSKESLQDFIKERVSKKWVNNVDEALYCLYRREGRKDIITMVKTLDLMHIASESINKEIGIVEHTIGDSIIQEKNIKKRINEIFTK